MARTPEDLPTPDAPGPLPPEGDPGAVPPVDEAFTPPDGEPVIPIEDEESRPALSGLRRFVTATRLAIARETHGRRQANDQVVRTMPGEAQVVRGFGTTKRNPTPEIDPETDTRTDAERELDDVLERHNRGPEDAATDHLPATISQRVFSLHRQGQAHKLRKIDRERAAHLESHGRSATADDLSEEQRAEIQRRTSVGESSLPAIDARWRGKLSREQIAHLDALDAHSRGTIPMGGPNARARWQAAVTKLEVGDMGKIPDDSHEAYVERMYGPGPEHGSGPHLRRYQSKAANQSGRVEGRLDRKAERLEGRLERGAAGETLPAQIRTSLIERAGNRVARLERRLAELNRLAGIETPEPVEPLPIDEEDDELDATMPRAERIRTEDDEIRDVLFHEPMIDREAIDALSDEEKAEIAASDRAMRLAGLLAPPETFSGMSEDERKLVYMTAEMRMRKFMDEKRPEGFESFDAGWLQGDGSIKPVRVIGLVPYNEALSPTVYNKRFDETTYVNIVGTKLPVPLKELALPKELRDSIEQIAASRRPAKPVRGERGRPERGEPRRSGRREEFDDEETKLTLADVDPRFHGLYNLTRIRQLDEDIAAEIIVQKDEELEGTGRSRLPRPRFIELGNEVRDDLTTEYLQEMAAKLGLTGYSREAIALLNQMVDQARSDREKESGRRGGRRSPRR